MTIEPAIGVPRSPAAPRRHAAAEQVQVVDDVDGLVAAWEGLADRVGASPFSHPGWILAWSAAFAGRARLRPVCVSRDQQLVAVLPVLRRGRNALSPTNWHTPAFTAVSADDAATESAVVGLLGKVARRATFSFVPDGDPIVGAVSTMRNRGVAQRVIQRSPHIAVEGSFDTYFAGRSSNLRGDVRRRLRRIQELGPVSLDVQDGTVRLESLLSEGLGLEGSGWKDDAGTAITSSPATSQFYTDVARWAARRGWLSLAFLRIGDTAVAFQYGIVANQTYYFLKGGYDPALSASSPGKVLHAMMIEQAFDRGLCRYDFLGGEERYKNAWASGGTDLLEVTVWDKSAAGSMEHVIRGHGRTLARDVFTHGSRLGASLKRRTVRNGSK